MADEIKIPVFDGKEYSTWKKRIFTFLKLKKCEETCKRVRQQTESVDDWNQKDLRAVNYIYSALSNKQMEFVNDEETAYGIIKKLDKLYLKESTALQICVRNKLEKIKLKDYSETSEFFSYFEKQIIELKNAGAQVTEKEKLSYLLRTLPSSLSYIGDFVDVMNEEDRTADFVKDKIKMHEIRDQEEKRSEKNRGASTNAFHTEKKQDRKVCYKCGKGGHLQYQCYSRGPHQRTVLRGARGQWHQYQDRQFNDTQGNRGSAHQGGRGGRGTGTRGRGSWNLQQRGDQRDQRDAMYSNVGEYDTSDVFCTEAECKKVEVHVCENDVEWVLDSGCTDHIINNMNYYSNHETLKIPVDVKIGNGKILKATKVGSVFINTQVYGNNIIIELQNVFCVEQMDRNLISFGKVTNRNKIVSKGNTAKIYNKRNKLIGIAYKVNDLYKLKSRIEKKETHLASSGNKTMTLKEKFHRMLGHVNFNYLDTLCNKSLVLGMPNKLETDYLRCGTCIQNKMHNIPFKNNRHRAKDLLDIIHTDLNGPHHTVGYEGEKYFLTFIDDFSKAAKVYTIKSKDQVHECFVNYINLVENLTGKKVKQIRCDNGTEYINKNIFRVASEKGIQIEPCPPYTHQLNGTAERYNRSVMDIARCLLDEANLNKKYWPEVIKTAVYLKNRTLGNTLENKTPYEIMMGEKPDISNLRLYGSKIFVRVPENKRIDKWERKAELGILVGYEKVGYRVLTNNKVVISRHVDIVEEDVNIVGLREDNDEYEENEKDRNNFKFEDLNEQTIESKNLNEQIELRRSQRNRQQPNRYTDSNYAYCIYVNYVSADSPIDYNEALNDKNYKDWQAAMNKDVGEVKMYLGINIDYDCKKNEMTIDQRAYIESLARKYEIENAKLYSTPMEQNLKCEPAKSASNELNFRNLIGALLYISSGTRMDINYSVNYLSRFQNCYDQTHYKYAMRILKYLYLTRELKLKFKKNKSADILDCHVDADWAGDNMDRRSTTGYVIRMNGNVIYWKTKKQGSVTKSSTAAEYVALSEAVSELKLLKDLLEDFKIKIVNPIAIYEDNSGTISIAKFGNFTKKSKYIETHYYFVNENYLKGIIDVKKIDTEDNVADIFTKALGRNKFKKFRSILNLSL